MLSQARRRTMFAAATSLLVLSAAGPAAAQDSSGPDGDFDSDGVVNAQDRCPSQAPSATGVDQYGCPNPPDSDGDGFHDEEDRCSEQAAAGYAGPFKGCPKPKGPDDHADTPAAEGPSCTSAQPCLVLESKGLRKRQDGTFLDPDATVTVTIARDARGVPARVVSVRLSKVDTVCTTYVPDADISQTPGPEVSTTLDPIALKGNEAQHANYVGTVFRFDPMRPVRTINGLKHELGFYMPGSDAELFISGAAVDEQAGRCILDVHAWLKPVKNGSGSEAAREQKAVAQCKKLPKTTKKQRRVRAKCLKNARG